MVLCFMCACVWIAFELSESFSIRFSVVKSSPLFVQQFFYLCDNSSLPFIVCFLNKKNVFFIHYDENTTAKTDGYTGKWFCVCLNELYDESDNAILVGSTRKNDIAIYITFCILFVNLACHFIRTELNWMWMCMYVCVYVIMPVPV